MSDKGPVIVTLNCEANPSTDTVEIDRAEWEAMTPAERYAYVTNAADEHINSSGGYGWYIADPDDEAMMGDAAPDPLRELAEWVASIADEPPGPEEYPVSMEEIITRAHEALRSC